MSVDKELQDLTVRVSVLEQQHAHAKEQMAQIKQEVEQCRADHTKTSDKLEARMGAVESVVDELRINTELTRKALLSLERMTEQIDHTNDSLDSIKLKLSRQDGFLAAALFLGGAAWALLSTFKDQILGWF
ncbi:hypothetical protein [Acidovorax sp.]|uniref:hypothetical protein n=1 Tax=Acidovorax sp. TaxID=1872122 RepID=UPI00391F50FC